MILEAKRLSEEDLRRSFWKGAADWDETGKKGESLTEKRWNRSQSNDAREEPPLV